MYPVIKSIHVFVIWLSNIDFSFLLFDLLDKFPIAPDTSLRTAPATFLNALLFPTFLANLMNLLNVLLKPLLRCLTQRPLPLGAALYLYGRWRRMFAGKSTRAACLYLAQNVLPFGSVTFFGVSHLTITILSLHAIFLSY